MACAAGARVADLEFVQFHPTVLSVAGAPRFLLSEALRGEGARLVNADGERVHDAVRPAGELASRDRVVARDRPRERRAPARRCTCRSRIWIPTSSTRAFRRSPRRARAPGLDLARDRMPVGPAAHYIMGGVETDLDGRTSLPGLFAAGEVACTGVHGANRLASNSLLEGLVFGARAGCAMRQTGRAGARSRRGAASACDCRHVRSARLTRPIRPSRPRPDVGRRRAVPRSRGAGACADVLDAAWQALDAPRCDAGRVRDAARLADGQSGHRRAARSRVPRCAARRAAAATSARIFPSATIYTGKAGWRETFELDCRPSATGRQDRSMMAADSGQEGQRRGLVTEITPQSEDFRAGTSTSSGAPSSPTTRPSRAAW